MRLVFMGTPDFAVPALQTLSAAGTGYQTEEDLGLSDLGVLGHVSEVTPEGQLTATA